MKSLKEIFAERSAGIEISFNRFRKVAVIIATGLTLVSCYFSGELFEKFALDDTDKAVWWCLAALLQGGMSVLAFFAGYSVMRKTGKAWIPTVMFLFLFCVSMVCSLGAMAEGSAVRESGAVSVKDRKETIQEQIASIDQQVNWNKDQMDGLSARSVFKNGFIPLKEQNDSLFSQKQELSAQLLGLQAEKVTDGNALFASLANIFGGAPSDFKDKVHFAISFAIDGTAIVLMLLAGGFAMGGIVRRDQYHVNPGFDEIDGYDHPGLPDYAEDETEPEIGHRDAPDMIMGDDSGDMYEIHRKAYNNPEAGFFATTLPAFLKWRKDKAEHDLTEKPDFQPADNQYETEKVAQAEQANQKAEFKPADLSAEQANQQANRQANHQADSVQTQAEVEQAKGPVQYSNQTPEPENDVPDNDTMTYLDALYSGNKKDGSLIGRRKIGDITGMKQAECDKIHTLLKRRGIIEVRGTATFPKVDLETAKAKLIGGAA